MLTYLAAFKNEPGNGPVDQLLTADQTEIDAFRLKHDKPGYAVFRCVNPLQPGSTHRRIETVARIERFAIDIDFKDLDTAPEKVDEALKTLPIPATHIRKSGGGRHVIFELKEPIEAANQDAFDKASRLLKRGG